MIGLLVLAGAIALVLSMLPSKKYECKGCDFCTYDREQAAGHVHLNATLHKIDL